MTRSLKYAIAAAASVQLRPGGEEFEVDAVLFLKGKRIQDDVTGAIWRWKRSKRLGFKFKMIKKEKTLI